MSGYIVRFANSDDIPNIMQFIDENWKKGHILAKDRTLFEWQYMSDEKLNMVIGEDENHTIQGILGFIPYADENDKDFSLALWKAKNGTAFLGVKLLMFLLKEEPHRQVFCNGINLNTTEGIYQRLGFKTGKLKQWYRLCDYPEYKIAKIEKKAIPNVKVASEVRLVKTEVYEELKTNASEKLFDTGKTPYKSESYISKRYFSHPVYEYNVYGLENESGKFDAAIVFRIQECNGAKALRVIDFIGEYSQIYHITKQIEEIAKECGAEYIDIYEKGLDDNCLMEAGWQLVGADENIIPNYFAPYTQCNVDINICTTDENIFIFKGDGDQDRPN